MGDKINKKLSEEELDGLLEEQFLRETQFIEEGLSFDESGRCSEESDEEIEAAYEKLIARIKSEGVYREESDDSDFESNTDDKVELSEELVPEIPGNNKITYMQEHKLCRIVKSGIKKIHACQGMKAAGIGIVIAVGVCAAAMSSNTNNMRIASNVKLLMQDDSSIVNGMDKEDEKVQKDDDPERGSHSVISK